MTRTLTVRAVAVAGNGDITVLTRDTLKALYPKADWEREDPKYCVDACGSTGGDYLHIGSSSLKASAYLHEVLHNFGLRHEKGIMKKHGGKINAKNIDDLAAVYDL